MGNDDVSHRILVTGGGRNFTNEDQIAKSLRFAYAFFFGLGGVHSERRSRRLTVLRGTSVGTDQAIKRVIRRAGFVDEPWPTHWAAPCHLTCPPAHRRAGRRIPDYCPDAASYKYEEMLLTGVNLVIAFTGLGSRVECLKVAKNLGVPYHEEPILQP